MRPGLPLLAPPRGPEPRQPAEKTFRVRVFLAREEPHDDGDAFLAGSCELTDAGICPR
jgi:hypothetical protein